MSQYRTHFASPHAQYRERVGQPFTPVSVIEEPDATHDAEVLPMYVIRFEDGTEIEAWPEEVLAPEGSPAPNSPAEELLTASQFVERILPVVRAEAGFTALERHDTTLGGYVADLQQACARILDGQIAVGGVRLPAPTDADTGSTPEEES